MSPRSHLTMVWYCYCCSAIPGTIIFLLYMVGSPRRRQQQQQQQQQQQPAAAASTSFWYFGCRRGGLVVAGVIPALFLCVDPITRMISLVVSIVPRGTIYNMPHKSSVVVVLTQMYVTSCRYTLSAASVALTAGGYPQLVLFRAHYCCRELRAAGRAYSHLLLVKHQRDTYRCTERTQYSAAPKTPPCDGTALRILERPVITWTRVIGIVSYYLGGVDGKPGVSGRGNEPQVRSSSCKKKIKLYLYLYPTKQVSDNENVHHGQFLEGIPV